MTARRRQQPADAHTAAGELRAAIAEAHAALKDLRAERLAAERLAADHLAAALAAHDARLEHELQTRLAAITAAALEAITQSEQRIFARFDRVADILLGADRRKRQQQRSLEEFAERLNGLRG